MHAHSSKSKKQAQGLDKIALIGNPNVGKSVIFGLLTGKYATVSNYPGTTVELTQANISLDGRRLLVIDTPGVNSLIPMSEDEKVTRDILLLQAPSTVIQVGDSKNLKRTLLITLQLAEMKLPMLLALNMIDEAMDRGISIDAVKLGAILGTAVISTIAPQRKGLKELKEAMLDPKRPTLEFSYHPLIEEHTAGIAALLPETAMSKRSLALMILSEDLSLRDWMKTHLSKEALSEIEGLIHACSLGFNEPVGYIINRTRIEKAEEICSEVIKKTASEGGKVLALFGRLSMHPVFGLPVLLAVLYGVYQFVGVFGAKTLVDFVENTIFNGYLNPVFKIAVETVVPFEIIRELLIGDYGLITMALTYAIAIILPITATFFLAFAVLEDSGYLPRLAIMSNRVFNIMGLNGKAVLPMILGLGCGTMAVMTSRILETRRDRIITTFLLALAIPCSAQLGVILGILGALSFKATLVWAGSLLLVLFSAGFLASKVIPGERTEFFLEIPPIRIPAVMNILVKTAGRIEWYLKEAVPLFMLGTFILFLFHKLNLLDKLERITSPVVVNLLDLPSRTAEIFILGFLRRDFGAAGLFKMFQDGTLSPVQAIVSLVTVTLFIPCLASFFMIIKERGLKTAAIVSAIVFPTAFLFGGALNWILRTFGISL